MATQTLDLHAWDVEELNAHEATEIEGGNPAVMVFVVWAGRIVVKKLFELAAIAVVSAGASYCAS